MAQQRWHPRQTRARLRSQSVDGPKDVSPRSCRVFESRGLAPPPSEPVAWIPPADKPRGCTKPGPDPSDASPSNQRPTNCGYGPSSRASKPEQPQRHRHHTHRNATASRRWRVAFGSRITAFSFARLDDRRRPNLSRRQNRTARSCRFGDNRACRRCNQSSPLCSSPRPSLFQPSDGAQL